MTRSNPLSNLFSLVCLFAVWMSSRQTRPGLLLLFACAHSALGAVDDVGRVYCAYPATTPAYVLLYSLSCCSTTQHCLPALSQSLDLGSSQRKRASERAFHLAYRGIVCMCVVSQAGRQAASLHPRRAVSRSGNHQRSNSVQPLASSRCRDRVKNCLFNATWLWEQDIIRQESIMAIDRYTCTATVRRHCSRLVNCGQVSEHKPAPIAFLWATSNQYIYHP